MSFPKTIGKILTALTIAGPVFVSAAQADAMVTYSWTTTSEGFGPKSWSAVNRYFPSPIERRASWSNPPV